MCGFCPHIFFADKVENQLIAVRAIRQEWVISNAFLDIPDEGAKPEFRTFFIQRFQFFED